MHSKLHMEIDIGLEDKIHNEATYHGGVLFRPPIISYNSQGVHVPFLSVQQTCHCYSPLKHQIQERMSPP